MKSARTTMRFIRSSLGLPDSSMTRTSESQRLAHLAPKLPAGLASCYLAPPFNGTRLRRAGGKRVKVIIPLAGKGTRLRPHTYTTPKPLLKVGGKPIMSYILDDLRELGVSEVIFVTGYLKSEVEAYIRREYPDFKAQFVEQAVQDGTAGAVKLAEPFIDEDVLIMFVDTLFDADLKVIRDLPKGLAGVIWAKEVEDYQRF